VQRLNAELSGLLRAIGVNFNPISVDWGSFEQTGECHAIANTRINCGKFIWESQAFSETLGFNYWKREETQFCFAVRTHREPLFGRERDCDLKHTLALSAALCFKILATVQECPAAN
jgi:hypothetical protein